MAESVFFISGWSCPAERLRPLADAFDSSVDLRPVAISELLADGTIEPAAGLSSYASAAAGLMRSQAGPVWLGGWSMGGMVAIECAAAMPERVQGLILVGTTLCFCSDAAESPGTEKAAVRAMALGLRRDFLGTLQRFYALAAHPFMPGSVATDLSCGTLIDGLTYLQETDLRPLACRVQCPALVIHGNRDAVVPVEAGYQLARLLPGGQWLPYEGAGHDIPIRWPGRLAKDISLFMRQQSSERSQSLPGDASNSVKRGNGVADNRDQRS